MAKNPDDRYPSVEAMLKEMVIIWSSAFGTP
jgi:hypothetical protein